MDKETMARKTAKKGKRVLRKNGTSLSQVEEQMRIGFVEPAISRRFEEVKTNIFETALLSWKLDDFQKGWSQEGMKGTMEWEGKRRKEEITDSQIEEEGKIQTVNSKKDLEKWLKQGDNSTLKVNWRSSTGSLARAMDTEMKEAIKMIAGMAESKHIVKELTEEEVDRIAREIGLENDKAEEEDKKMKKDKEEGRGDLFIALQDYRNALGLILKNKEVVA